MQFDIIVVLREYNIPYTEEGEKLKVACPFHPDKNPSGYIYLESKRFKCYGCNASVRFIEYLSKKLDHTNKTTFHQLYQKLAPSADKVIQIETVDLYIKELLNPTSKQFIDALFHRCLTPELIEKYRIGVFKDRITIPVFSTEGYCVNIRKYKPGASERKIINQSGFGKIPRLYPIEQIEYEDIVLCGGELKAIIAAAELNQYEIGAVCCTQGESSLPDDVLEHFRGCRIWIFLDIDDTGVLAAEKHAKRLSSIASWIGIVDLKPHLDIEKYPKGDINDFIREGGKLKPLLDATEKWEFKEDKEKQLVYSEPFVSKLTDAVHAKFAGKRIKFSAVVSQIDDSPFTIPKELKVICDKSEKFCEACPVYFASEDKTFKIQDESSELIEMIGAPKKNQRSILIEAVKIPPMCRKCSFEVIEYFNFEEVRISEKLDISNRTSERSMQIAYCIGEQLNLNETYEMTGRMYPHPATQQACFLVSGYDQSSDSLATYQCEDTEVLKVFQPKEWTLKSIKDKLAEVYTDLETNVTQIYFRKPLHLAIDLVYHSPLFIQLDDKQIKGWTEILLLGDSDQGKSQATDLLMGHYQLGEKVDCKTTSVAGLKGGVDDISKRHFVAWGVIPTQDKRLVVLEELKGMHPEVFASLTEMRSSGKAEIKKIRRRETQARTRLLAISNPRSGRPVSSYNHGLEAIKELIPHMEDIRRFDACFIYERSEVDANAIPHKRPDIKHIYTTVLCKELILWCWTRDYAVFEDERHIQRAAKELSEIFSDEIPIVNRMSVRLKIARLAAALAGRTFSTENDTVFVRNCHVDFIKEFLIKEYSKPCYGYKEFSESAFQSEQMSNTIGVKHRITNKVPHPAEFVEHLLLTDEINLFFIQDLLGYDQDSARGLLSYLIRQRALKREGKYYRKTQEFVSLLKEMNGKVNRPEHIPDDRETFS